MKIDFIKYNSLRKDEFNLKTVIESAGGARTVKKIPASEPARAFTERIAENRRLLLNQYKNVKICGCERNDEGVIAFDFTDGKSITETLNELLKANDKKGFIDLLFKYKSLLLDNDELQTENAFNVTKDFTDVFGEYYGDYPFEYIKISNIDMSFDNLIYNGQYTAIDYEWVFDFPVPLNYIIARNLFNLFHKLFGESAGFIALNEVLELFGINDAHAEAYLRMEGRFQAYVYGDGFSVNQRYLKNQYTFDMLQGMRETEKNRFYAKLYRDSGGGLNESECSVIRFDKKDGELAFPLENAGAFAFRLDPTDRNCVLSLERAYATDVGGRAVPLKLVSANAFYYENNMFYFSTNDPMIYFKTETENNIFKEVRFKINFLLMDYEKIKAIEDFFLRFVFRITDLEDKTSLRISRAEAERERYAGEYESAKKIVENLTADLTEKFNAVCGLEQEIAQMKKSYENSRAENEVMHNEIVKLVERANDGDAEIIDLTAENERLYNEIIHANEENKNTIDGLRSEILELSNVVKSIKNSTSWRLTGPIRRIMRIFKRGRK